MLFRELSDIISDITNEQHNKIKQKCM